MGFLNRMSTTVAPARMRATAFSDYNRAFWSGDDLRLGGGDAMSPDVALSLSYVYCAVDTISSDFGTSTCQMFEGLDDDSRRRVKYSTPGIGALARKLQWQPNTWMTAKAFWSTLAWQYLLRPAAYAELTYQPKFDSFLDQMIPRNPDRVSEGRLPSGRIQFTLREANGQTRTLTQDEMFVVRNTTMDGLRGLGRMEYGGKALASALELQKFTTNYFKKGVTASLLAVYKGELEEEDEKALHGSISRYMSGVENAGGLMLVPEDVDVKPLGVSAHDAELIGLKNISGRDVARMFKMPPSWLGIENASSYGSQIADAQNYKNRCQLPMAVEFEQAIKRDLIIAVDRFFAKFNLDYLTRGNLLERMQSHEIAIRSRIYRPSTAQKIEDLPVDYALDKLSESDFRPGTAGGTGGQPQQETQQGGQSARAALKGMLAIHDNAVRVVRRERVAVGKLATKHANNVTGWQAGLQDFYDEHAGFVADTMRVSMDAARGYAAGHGSELETSGVVLMTDAWEREQAEALCALTLEKETA